MSLSDIFCASDSKGKGNRSKNKQMGLHQTENLLHSERKGHQNKNVIY